jgi:hypothetical protein
MAVADVAVKNGGTTVRIHDRHRHRLDAMITEDQAAVIDFLAASATHGGAPVERIDTHASIVFLAGERAYKLKRAVRFDYLDFSTSERRRLLCEAEVRLNRRTAPTLYRGVVAVTREHDGSYALAGSGKAVDWVVEMNRFPQEALFDRLASTGDLAIDLMCPLAVAIADFHRAAEQRPDHGGKAGMAWVIEGNAAGFAEFGRGWLDLSTAYQVTDGSNAAASCSTGDGNQVSFASVTGISISATSCCWTDDQPCSTVSSSTTRLPAPTCCTTSPSF